MATPILSAPADLKAAMSSGAMTVGETSSETGMSKLDRRSSQIFIVCPTERLRVSMEMQILLTVFRRSDILSMMLSRGYAGQGTLMKLFADDSPGRAFESPQ
jgi:hypothetical protein